MKRKKPGERSPFEDPDPVQPEPRTRQRTEDPYDLDEFDQDDDPGDWEKIAAEDNLDERGLDDDEY